MSHIVESPSRTHDRAHDTEILHNELIAAKREIEISRRSVIKAAFALAGSAVLFGGPQRALAASASQETLDALASAEESLNKVQAQLDEIGAQFQALSVEQAKTLEQIEDTQNQIDNVQAQIDKKEEELEAKQALLSSRVSDSYKKGPAGALNLILSSESFEELLSNSHYVEKINDADKEIIGEIQTIRAELEQQKADLEAHKVDLEALQKQQAAQLEEMKSKQAEIKSIMDGLSQDVKDLMAKRDAEYAAAVEEEERQRKAAEAAAAAAAANKGGGTTYIPGNGEQTAAAGSQRAVVNACYSTPSPGSGLCAAWVTYVFINAGVTSVSGNACDMYSSWCTSSNKSNLKVGMIIAVSTHPHTSAGIVYGHVGVYVGNNTVMDNIGYIRSINVDEWISYYGSTVTPRWGWLGGIQLT